MRAVLGIEAAFGQSQTFYGTAVDEVLGDDLVHVLELDKAIPDGLGIDHHHRAMFTLIKTSRLVGTDKMLQARVFDGIFEGGFDLLRSMRKAAGTGRGFIALVGANKEMVFEFRHERGLLSLPRFATADRAGRVSF